MKSSNKIINAAAFAVAAFFTASANADVIIADYADYGVWNAYDTVNEAYAVKFRTDDTKDGFWLVATAGDNPKGDGASHAILYGDLKNNRITAYTYNGENSSNSFERGTLLGTYENVFSPGGTDAVQGYDLTMFSLDVSSINNALGAEFDGVQIGEEAGIWFHQSSGSEFTYGADGSIVDYVFDTQMFLDVGNNDNTIITGTADCITGQRTGNVPGYINSCDSTQLVGGFVGSAQGGGSVPAPGGLALILLSLAGFGLKLRRKS